MTNPVVDLRVVGQEAQSSEYPLIPNTVEPDEKNNPESGEFLYTLKLCLPSLCLRLLVVPYVGLVSSLHARCPTL